MSVTRVNPVPPVPTPSYDAVHHFSHRQLLTRVNHVPRAAPVDGIIVPSGRTAPYLDHAIDLADRLGCQLLVLCSRYAYGEEVVARARRSDAAVVAIDVAGLEPWLPPLRTSELLKGGLFDRRTDISFKRNLGLLIARAAGWQRIAFLDDDIKVLDPDDLGRAAGLAGTYDIVGLGNAGFPDNSVVCHANRLAGAAQDTFVGGGAMVLDPFRTNSFFPNIYNEDWFFLLGDAGLGSVGVFGTMMQKRYDPYAHPQRARSEEFGDCLAEGVYSLLDQGRTVGAAEDPAFWGVFLDARRRLIDHVLERVRATTSDPVTGVTIHPAEKERMMAALKAAQGRRALITPARCVDYLGAWRADRNIWQAHLLELARRRSLGGALHTLRVPDRVVHRAGRRPDRRRRALVPLTHANPPVTAPALASTPG